jgi:hypothetical protein
MQPPLVRHLDPTSVLARSLTAGSSPEEACQKAHRRPHLHMGKAWGYPWSYPTGSLTLARAPARTRGSLRASRYLGKNTRVVDGSLYLYLTLSFRIYSATLVMYFTFLS